MKRLDVRGKTMEELWHAAPSDLIEQMFFNTVRSARSDVFGVIFSSELVVFWLMLMSVVFFVL